MALGCNKNSFFRLGISLNPFDNGLEEKTVIGKIVFLYRFLHFCCAKVSVLPSVA